MSLSEVTNIQIFATLFLFLAVLHTFSVKFFQKQAHRYKPGSIGENLFHFLGEIEIVFGLWAAFFVLVYTAFAGKQTAIEYLESRSFNEPALVFVLMVVCSTKPVLDFATMLIEKISSLLPFNRHASFYMSTLIIGPLLGSLITEPAAMTVTALILLKYFYNQGISQNLKYATLGLLFVNISVGGTLTSFAAPPVLMVAHKWNWDSFYMLTHFGWKAVLSVIISTFIITLKFKKEFAVLTQHSRQVLTDQNKKTSPWWIIGIHLVFLLLIIMNHQHLVVFVSLLLFFLGFISVTDEYQSPMVLRGPLLVAFFLGGLVVLGGMQDWWLSPLLKSLSTFSLYIGAIALTAVTDNAALTYLGSQVSGLSEFSKYALVAGSVIGGGLTVIANAPNPAGYSILNSSFGKEGISSLKLFKSALIPTVLAAFIFWIF